MEKYLIVQEPKLHESIQSYLLRLTNANGYSTPYWIYENVGLIKKGLKLLVPRSPSLENLHKLTNVEQDVLDKLTYFYDLKITGDNKGEYSLVYHYSIDGKYSKICPLCFNENPYQRKFWDYKTVIACPIHKCLLINKCNKCGKMISHYRSALLQCKCGANLSDLPLIKASTDEIDYAILIYKNFGFSDLPFLKQVNNSEINKLKLYQILFLSISLLNRIYYVKEGNFLTLNYDTENPSFRILLEHIYRVFNDWPNGYYKYLKIYQENTNNNKNKNGVSYDFHQLYLYLYKNLSSDDYCFLKSEFENYIGNYWEDGSVRNSKYLTVKDSKFIDSETALQKYGITSKTLRKLYEDNKINGKVNKKVSIRTYLLIEEADLVNFIDYMDQFVSKVKAAKLLGINHKNLNIFIREKHLFEDEYLFKRLRKGSVKKSDIEAILETFKIFSRAALENKNLVNSDNLLLSLSPRLLNISDLYKMISNGLLTPYYEGEITLGIRSYLYDQKELEDAIQFYLTEYCDFLTSKMIMKLYNIHENNIYDSPPKRGNS